MGTQTTTKTEYFTRTPYGFHRRGLVDLPVASRERAQRTATMPHADHTELLQAFAGFAQSQLIESNRHPHPIRSTGPLADRALDWLRRCGFSIDEVRALQFGLYTTPSDVESFLSDVGFHLASIAPRWSHDRVSRLLNPKWAGCLVVPLHDRFGEIVDLGLIHFDRHSSPTMRYLCGASETGIVAYGLDHVLTLIQSSSQTSEERTLILVEDVLDALTLQSRGFSNAAAIGTLDEMTPHRWEALFDLGFARVDLIFPNHAAYPARMRHFLTSRDKATRCPEVCVFDSTQFGPGVTASEFVIRQGRDALRHLLNGRSYVRRQWVEPEFTQHAHKPQPKRWYAFQPERYWEEINHRLQTLIHRGEYHTCRHMAGEVAEALGCGRFDEAHQILDQWPIERLHPMPTTPQQVCEVFGVDTALDLICDKSPLSEPSTWCDETTAHTHGEVTVISAEDARSRQERLIDTLLSDLRMDDDGLSVIVCEGGLRRFATLLVHRLASEQAQGEGLSLPEVVHRLQGSEPSGGFRDKPWLVDEAVDRISEWSDRLCFVEQPSSSASLQSTLHDLQRNVGPLAGIYLDAEHGFWQEWSQEGNDVRSPWHQLSHDFDCPVVVSMSDQSEDRTPLRHQREHANNGMWRRTAPTSPNGQISHRDAHDFRSLLRHWVVQTERRSRFDQPIA